MERWWTHSVPTVRFHRVISGVGVANQQLQTLSCWVDQGKALPGPSDSWAQTLIFILINFLLKTGSVLLKNDGLHSQGRGRKKRHRDDVIGRMDVINNVRR